MAFLDALALRLGRRLPLVLQTEATECGLACLAMIAGYHGHHTGLMELRRRFSVSLKGISLKQLIQTAHRLGGSYPSVIGLEDVFARPADLGPKEMDHGGVEFRRSQAIAAEGPNRFWARRRAGGRLGTFLFRGHGSYLLVSTHDLEVWPGRGREIDENFPASKTGHDVMGADVHLGYSGGDLKPLLAPGEGLFIDVRVEQQTCKRGFGVWFQDDPLWGDDIPPIGVILPSRIRVADGYKESPASIGIGDGSHEEDVGIRDFCGLRWIGRGHGGLGGRGFILRLGRGCDHSRGRGGGIGWRRFVGRQI